MKRLIITIIGLLLIATAIALPDNLGFENGMDLWQTSYTSTGINYTSNASDIWHSEGDASVHMGGGIINATTGNSASINHLSHLINIGDQVCVDVNSDEPMMTTRLRSDVIGFGQLIQSGETFDICAISASSGLLDLIIEGTMEVGCVDCLTNVYLDNIRIYSCTDNNLNNSETDVDCGGPFCDACGNGKSCIVDSDCESGLCSGDTCSSNEQSQSSGGSGGTSSSTITDYISVRKEDYTSKEEVEKSIDQLNMLYSGTLSAQQKKIFEQKLEALEALLASFDETVLEEQTVEKEEAELDLIRSDLELAEGVSLSEETAELLLSIKNTDEQNYDDIADIVKDAPDEQKEVLIEELADMDPDFTRQLNNQDNTKEQIRNYARSVKQGVKSKESILNDGVIGEIFSGERSLDDILSSLNSLDFVLVS